MTSRTLLREPPALAGAIVSITIAAIILAATYNRSWYPPDDGAYAHVAERILGGEILNSTIQDVHPGYVNFVHAGAMALLGVDLLSLRIPLAIITVVQALLMYLTVRRTSIPLAIAAAVGLTSLSFPQFANPTAHWYCLFLTVSIAYVVANYPRSSGRTLVLGILVGTALMFRQLTGAILAIATLAWLLTEARTEPRGICSGQLLMVLLATVLSTYLLLHAHMSSALFIGLWPVAVLIMGVARCRIGVDQTFKLAALLGTGIVAAAAPLIVYHISKGTLSSWLLDITVAALQIPALPFVDEQSLGFLMSLAVANLISFERADLTINALFWLSLLLLPLINGAALLWRLQTSGAEKNLIVPFFATFYSVVSLHYEIPTYVFYSAGLNLVAAGILLFSGGIAARRSALAFVPAISMIALHFHAGQSLARGIDGTIAGSRGDAYVPCAIHRCSLVVDARDVAVTRGLIERIVARTRDDECILAVPSDAQLYFLTERCNPVRFFNSALALHRESDVDEVLKQLRSNAPAMLIHRVDDKYNTPLSDALISGLKQVYARNETLNGYDLFWDPVAPHAMVRE